MEQFLTENNLVYFSFEKITTVINEKTGEEKKKLNGIPLGWANLTQETSFIKPEHMAYGVVTGEISGITVIDFDNLNTYNLLIQTFPELNKCMKVKTRNGYHLYFKYNSDLKTTTDVGHLPGIDIRNDDGFVIGPTTRYKTLDGEKHKYKLIKGELMEIPKTLLSQFKDNAFYSSGRVKSSLQIMDMSKTKKEHKPVKEDKLEKVLNMLPCHSADNYNDWNEVGLALNNSYDEDTARKLFHIFSKRSKKYNEDEVNKHFDSYKKCEGGLTVGTIMMKAKEANPEEYAKLNPQYNSKFWDSIELLNNADLAEYYIKQTEQKFIYSKGSWYGYDDNNIITKIGEKTPSKLMLDVTNILKQKLVEEMKKVEPGSDKYNHTYKIFKKAYPAMGMAGWCKGIIDFLQAHYNNDTLGEKLNSNNYLLAFNNKVYDFKLKKFRPIEKNDFISITTGYDAPIKSNPEILTKIKNIIYSVFENDEMVNYWLQSVSMAIHTNKFENFYIHTGAGRNGKGMLFSLISSALGKYVSIADSEFLTSRIESGKPNPVLCKTQGKRMLFITEPSTEDNKKNVEVKMNVDLIKKLSGNDEIESRDLYQKADQVVTFKPQFTCFLQCNQKPELGKLDKGIKERLKIIEYPFTFKEASEVIPNTNDRVRNDNLKEELQNQDFINEFILLLINTVNNFNKFNTPAQVQESNKEYFDSCDPIKEWLNNNYIITNINSDRIRTSEILLKFNSSEKVQMTSSKFINYMKFHEINTKIYQGYNYFIGIKEKTPTNDLDV